MLPDLLFIDTETSGLNPDTDVIIEVAAVRWSYTRGIVRQFEARLMAQDGSFPTVPPNVAAINGYSRMRWAHTAVSYLDGLKAFYAEMDADTLLTAANAPFDLAFLGRAPIQRPKTWSYHAFDLSTFIFSELVVPGMIPKPKLQEAARFLGLGEQEHTALSDCLLAVRVYERLLEVRSRTVLRDKP
jgi:DNA polymerase III epsilon subunit-like protein